MNPCRPHLWRLECVVPRDAQGDPGRVSSEEQRRHRAQRRKRARAESNAPKRRTIGQRHRRDDAARARGLNEPVALLVQRLVFFALHVELAR